MLSRKRTPLKKITLRILRRQNAEETPYWQDIEYTLRSESDTVATALETINSTKGYTDVDGNVVRTIRWECSCLQKKCGACAMVIDGRPRLACDALLSEYAHRRILKIEPLRKFPCIQDLVVDRSVLHENMKAMELWTNRELALKDEDVDISYESSLCLQCGICLEVCPNFEFDGSFFGAAAYVPTARLLLSLDENEREVIRRPYERHVYEGCAKSLSCKDVCPVGIDTEKLLVKSNAIAVWRRKDRKK